MSENIFFVDDEVHVLRSLMRLFLDEEYDIKAFESPVRALDALERDGAAVVVSDHRMPEMEGPVFLEKVQAASPDTVRLILTGYADLEAAVSAINQGHVYRYLNKPWDEGEMKSAVGNALDLFRGTRQNKQLVEATKNQNEALLECKENLEKKVEERTRQVRALLYRVKKGFSETIKVFSDQIEIFNPTLGEHVTRVAEFSRKMAERHGLEENSVRLTEISARLHDIGLIGLPRRLFSRGYNKLDKHEQALLAQNPVIGYEFLNRFDELKEISFIVRSFRENYDGTGYPDGLKQDIIPLEARIIRLANDFDILVYRKNATSEEAVRILQAGCGSKYDPDVMPLLMDVLQTESPFPEKTGKVLPLQDVRPGMILVKPVKTGSGRPLLTEGMEITEALLEKLHNFHRVDPIVDLIYVAEKPRHQDLKSKQKDI